VARLRKKWGSGSSSGWSAGSSDNDEGFDRMAEEEKEAPPRLVSILQETTAEASSLPTTPRLPHAAVVLLSETFADVASCEHAFTTWKRTVAELDPRGVAAMRDQWKMLLKSKHQKFVKPAAAVPVLEGVLVAVQPEVMKDSHGIAWGDKQWKRKRFQLGSRTDLMRQPTAVLATAPPRKRCCPNWREKRWLRPWFYCVWDSVRFWRVFPWLVALSIVGVTNFFTLWVAMAAFYGETKHLESWLQSVAISFGWAWLVQEPLIVIGRSLLVPQLVRSPTYQMAEKYIGGVISKITTQLF